MTSEPPRWDERLLDGVAADLEWPRTPDLRVRVVASVEDAPASASRWWPRPGLAVAAAVLFALVLLLAVEPARTAVAEFFGLVEGERIEFLPPPPPGETATPLPAAVGIQEYGERATLPDLRDALDFAPALPGGVGEPDAVYLIRDAHFAAIAVLAYERFDLWQTRFTDFGYFGKGIPPSTFIEQLKVGEQPAYWIAGGNHILRFVDTDGQEIAGSQRTVDRNTLVWQGPSGTTYRIETDLPLADALAIAETLP